MNCLSEQVHREHAHRARRAVALCAAVICLSFPLYGNGGLPSTRPGVEARIDSLLSIMTVEEKVGQLVQVSGDFSTATGTGGLKPGQAELIRQGRVGSLLNVIGARATHEAQWIAVEESRLKIPLLFGFDVIHGYRTTFPIPLAEAASWDPDLARRTTHIAASEAAAAGIHWTFAPMVDIARDARWGRIAEGSGEDTYLGSVFAAARVNGFQGTDVAQPDAIMACVKHFAAYGAAEGGRDYNTVDISERTLREVYLPPFHAALQAGAATVMSSFNEISGLPSTANKALLTDILRGEWGFDGFVVSDWNSVGELLQHRIASSREEAAKVALEAGLDMDMEGHVYEQHLVSLVERGTVPRSVLDMAVRRVLRAKFRLGLFENPYRGTTAEDGSDAPPTAAHRAAAREAAQKSIVLLKNAAGTLPLRGGLRTIALIGPLADDRDDLLGPWAQAGRPEDVVTLLQGVRNAAGPNTNILYERGCAIDSEDAGGFRAAVEAARNSEAVILVLGESASMSGEAASRSSLDLPGNQNDLARAVAATGKPIAVVLLNGRPLSINWIAENIPAVVEAWFPGLEGGNAIADVLFGKINPSAKLPVTFPRGAGEEPLYYNARSTGRPANDRVRFTSRYIDRPVAPLYPFGYGLSYTTFAYAGLRVAPPRIQPGGSLRVSVEVGNTGEREGSEVVQLYVRDDVASVTRPVKELRGFRKLSLAPGERKTIEFTLAPDDLSLYDKSMRRVVEPGTFTVFVGPNSAEGLQASFEVTAGSSE